MGIHIRTWLRLSAASGITEKQVIWKLWSYLVEDDASHQIESE